MRSDVKIKLSLPEYFEFYWVNWWGKMQHLFQALDQMDRKINGEEYVRWDSVSNVINIFCAKCVNSVSWRKK